MSQDYYYFLFSKHYSVGELFDLTVEAIVDEETEYTGRYRATMKSLETEETSTKEFYWNTNGKWHEKGNDSTLLAEMIGKEIENYVE